MVGARAGAEIFEMLEPEPNKNHRPSVPAEATLPTWRYRYSLSYVVAPTTGSKMLKWALGPYWGAGGGGGANILAAGLEEAAARWTGRRRRGHNDPPTSPPSVWRRGVGYTDGYR
jgi:hypothetical protein